VQLPQHVRRAIEERAAEIGTGSLKKAAEALSDSYRSGAAARIGTPERAAAYAAVRMPATFAAAFSALSQLRDRLGERAIGSVLDIGAGSGAASLAAAELFPGAAITMLERDPALSSLAKEWLPEARVMTANINNTCAFPESDLVIAAYSLGELGRAPIESLWLAARVALVVIEPGTPAGYSLVLRLRAALLASGAYIAAPCPSDAACPLAAPDWCHFGARAERSRVHRMLKGADLGYEDEKFSYIAVAREQIAPASARIIRRPVQTPGLIQLEVCTPDGAKTVKVTKRDREAFRAARRAGWGSAWK
jgi:ribosomal protein RSM22 (predicted rRNA methylase)